MVTIAQSVPVDVILLLLCIAVSSSSSSANGLVQLDGVVALRRGRQMWSEISLVIFHLLFIYSLLFFISLFKESNRS